jgi:hypothetical protein
VKENKTKKKERKKKRTATSEERKKEEGNKQERTREISQRISQNSLSNDEFFPLS